MASHTPEKKQSRVGRQATGNARKPKLIATFKDSEGLPWRVYHANRKEHKHIFTHDGKPAYGRCFFATRRIYIDNTDTADATFEITLHELAHVALRELGLDDMIEEAFVERFSSKLADYLSQLKV